MDEYIDIADKDGNLTGETQLKSIIHKTGLYHHTAHIWFYTKEGEVLLSQRSAKKTICPLMWDVSVAGHVGAGETIESAAIRETKEEIGLFISEKDLIKFDVFDCFQSYESGIIDNEFHNTFICELKTPFSHLTPQIEEVEAIKLVHFKIVELLLMKSETNNHFVASNRDYYKKVLEFIRLKTNSN
ncbi:MAG: NUDIX domain-containing protein [Algibacter sp.]